MYCARAPRLSRLAQVSLGTLNALSAYDDGRGGGRGKPSVRELLLSSSWQAVLAYAGSRTHIQMATDF